MNFDDLQFAATDCCAQHLKAQVVRGDFVTTITDLGEGLYSLTVTNAAGLVERRSGLTRAQVDAAIANL